ncbi:Uncharacterised protein [Vibrio cholerae]|nr:Uncharacterised protein [Vibrio cholerae]
MLWQPALFLPAVHWSIYWTFRCYEANHWQTYSVDLTHHQFDL